MQHRSVSRLVEVLESGVALEGRRVRIIGLTRGESLDPSAVFVSGEEKAPMWCLSFGGVEEIIRVLGLEDRNSRCSLAIYKRRDLGPATQSP